MNPICDLPTLLRELAPVLSPGRFEFATLPAGAHPDPERALATVREPEGWSVLQAAEAESQRPPYRWITLMVPSDLAAVGLTAAVAQALAAAELPCNVIAGHHHDHLLVPAAEAERAMAVLRELQAQEAGA